MSTTLMSAGMVLADDKGKGSPVGLFVVLALCVAVYFLLRSMSRHLRKVPAEFDPPSAASTHPTGATTEPGGATTEPGGATTEPGGATTEPGGATSEHDEPTPTL